MKYTQQNLGIVTIACGSNSFVEMAKNLARSLEWSGMNLQRAVITDYPDTSLKKYYQKVIYQKKIPKNYQAKLYLNELSPFPHAFFIDSDCLVYENFFSLCKDIEKYPFVACGEKILKKDWAGIGLKFIKKYLNPKASKYILLHSGFFYFKSGNDGDKIFKIALKIEPFIRKSFPNEFSKIVSTDILFSIAASVLGWNKYWQKDPALLSPSRLWTFPANLDIRKRAAYTTINGRPSSSLIVHFMDKFKDSRLYKSEAYRLKKIVPKCLFRKPASPYWTFIQSKKTWQYSLWCRWQHS